MAKEITRIPGSVKTVGNINLIPLSAITEQDGYNPRKPFNPETREKDRSLVASMLANGWYENIPALVRYDAETRKIVLVRGHRRVAAAKAANAKGASILNIPAQLERADVTEADRTVDLIASNDGEEFTPDEKGVAVLRLRKFGWTDTDIAQKFGVVIRSVQLWAKLARQDKRLLALVEAGILSADLANRLVQTHGEDTAAKIAEDAARELEARKKSGTARGKKAAKLTPETVAPSEEKLTGGTRVTGKKKAAPPPAPPGTPPAPRKAPAMTNGAGKPGETKVKTWNDVKARLVGPFRLSDGDVLTVVDTTGEIVCYPENVDMAACILMLANQGWTTFTGRPVEAETPPPANDRKAPARKAPVRKARGK